MLKPIITIIVIALLTACNSQEDIHSDNDHKIGEMSEEHHSHEQNNHTNESNKDMDSKSNISDNSIISPIISKYLQLKNSLVKDNSKDAADEGKMLFETFKNFDKSILEKSKLKEFGEIVEDAMEHAEHISGNANNIEHQREHFEILSTDINDLITLLGTDRTLYIVKCPMYNDSKGGKWISETKEIKNPFYGSKMMKCGSVISTIN